MAGNNKGKSKHEWNSKNKNLKYSNSTKTEVSPLKRGISKMENVLKKKRDKTHYHYMEWIRGNHYRSYRHKKDKSIYDQFYAYPLDFLNKMDKFLKNATY